MRKCSGFTLIELLVVIAIIALLMAILMPALNRAKAQAREMACRSNLKQIGLAAQMYADVWAGYVPRGINASNPNPTAWFQRLMPYLSITKKSAFDITAVEDYRDVKIYRCLSYPDKEQTICYVINGWYFKGRNDYTGGQSPTGQVSDQNPETNITLYKRLAETIYLADNENSSWRGIITRYDFSDPAIRKHLVRCDVWAPTHLPQFPEPATQSLDRGRRVAQERHKKGCNCLYFDGHVEHVLAEEMNETVHGVSGGAGVDMFRLWR